MRGGWGGGGFSTWREGFQDDFHGVLQREKKAMFGVPKTRGEGLVPRAPVWRFGGNSVSLGRSLTRAGFLALRGGGTTPLRRIGDP